jgi:hypothetical protein
MRGIDIMDIKKENPMDENVEITMSLHNGELVITQEVDEDLDSIDFDKLNKTTTFKNI